MRDLERLNELQNYEALNGTHEWKYPDLTTVEELEEGFEVLRVSLNLLEQRNDSVSREMFTSASVFVSRLREFLRASLDVGLDISTAIIDNIELILNTHQRLFPSCRLFSALACHDPGHGSSIIRVRHGPIRPPVNIAICVGSALSWVMVISSPTRIAIEMERLLSWDLFTVLIKALGIASLTMNLHAEEKIVGLLQGIAIIPSRRTSQLLKNLVGKADYLGGSYQGNEQWPRLRICLGRTLESLGEQSSHKPSFCMNPNHFASKPSDSGGEELALKICTNCKVTAYCGERCQREDWKQIHKRECGDLAKEYRKLVDAKRWVSPTTKLGDLLAINSTFRAHDTLVPQILQQICRAGPQATNKNSVFILGPGLLPLTAQDVDGD
ncbi:hypothetical protein CC2G_013450 [Coprinopsis cinerea AmutBmut pab1-1]|nr:hypothetical protein CC2G_013450 [Coprinopsis cinerea AmutBmut pab1-1]